MPFRIALSGLNAASSNLDTTANNVSNVNTTGFNKSRAEFGDLFATQGGDVTQTATGDGVRLQNVAQQFTQGNIEFTENNLDMAVSGEGFFTLMGDEGEVYTRAGNFSADDEGFVENNRGERLQVYPPTGDGDFNLGQMEDLRLTTDTAPPQATSEIEAELNLPADAEEPSNEPFDPDDAQSFNNSRSTTVYDSLGNGHDATFYFVKGEDDGVWETHLYVNDEEVGGPEELEFDSNGELIVPADGEIDYGTIDPGTGADDLGISIDYSGSTQFGSSFAVNELGQDGFAEGELAGFDTNEDGIISARFTNGETQELGQIALADFDNPQALQELGDTRWGETADAGEVQMGAANQGGFGAIQAGALEEANVDLTEELVDMITAQRNFQANAEMISTTDAITQSIINIR